MKTKTNISFLAWTAAARAAGARVAMLLLLLVTTATAWAQTSVSYRAYNTGTKTFEMRTANSCTAITAGTTTMGAAGNVTWYVVSSNVTISSRITVNGTVHLILCDGKTLTASKGITVNNGNTLNIYGQAAGTGTLNATGAKLGDDGTEAAGIGSTGYSTVGNISIHGGHITATGADWSAGIGGGVHGGGGSITIYGGTTSAAAGEPNYGDQEAIGSGASGANVTKALVDGLRVTIYDHTAPVEYGNRVSCLYEKTVRVEPCTAHNLSNNVCTYCGLTIYTVTYNSNYASSGTVPAPQTSYQSGQTVTILGNTGNLVRTGYTFSGWNTAANGSGTDYTAGTTFAINNSLTLYAKWTPIGNYADSYIAYNDATGEFETRVATNYTEITESTTSLSNGFYMVRAGHIQNYNRITVSGTVHLILCDGADLWWAGTAGGVNVENGATLHIYGQSGDTGKLTAGSQNSDPGIGPGNVIVHGGFLDAHGSSGGGAAIGGKNGSLTGGTLTVRGGRVNGSDSNHNYVICCNATITGGTVEVTQYSQAFGGTITLGNMKVYGSENATTPVNASERESTCRNTYVKIVPCTEHNMENYVCTWCGFTICHVTYDGNNATSGTAPTDATDYDKDETITVRGNTGNLVRTGYTFAGWNTAADGSGTNYAPGATFAISGPVTLYAKWTPITYTVCFHKNQDEAIGTMSDQMMTYDAAQALTANAFTRQGYIFIGWSTTPDGPVAYTDGQNVSNLATEQDAVVNLYARWAIPYTITYDLDGGSVATPNPTVYTVESETITLNNPTRTGYTFAGWTGTDLDEPTMTVTIAAGSTGNRTYTATWTLNTYTITYNLDGGTVATANPTSYTYFSNAITLVNPTREGYDFAGWTGTDLTEATMIVTIPNGSMGNRDYTAHWLISSVQYYAYNTTTQLFEEHFVASPTTITTRTTTIGTANTVTWYAVRDDISISSRITVIGTVNLILCDGKTLTATNGITVGEGNTLKIYGQSGGTGSLVATVSNSNSAGIGSIGDAHRFGTIIIHGGIITATGGSWSAGIGGGVNGGGGTVNIYGGTVKATGMDGNAQAIGHGSSGIDISKTLADGLRVTVNNNSTPVGDSDRLSSLGQKVVRVEPCTNHNKENNKCTWCGGTLCNVTYNGNNATSGTAPNDATDYVYGRMFTVPGNTGNLERTGYTFVGWNTAADGSGTTYAEGATFAITGSVTLYAKWILTEYTISYDLDGGSTSSPQANPTNYTYTDEDITLVNPTREGYEFAGWTGSNGDIPQTTVTVPTGSTGNRSYTANWALIYSISYDGLEDGTFPSTPPTTYTELSETFTLVNPVRELYDFAGWTGTGLTQPTITVTIPKGSTGDRTYHATWSLKEGTYISYNTETRDYETHAVDNPIHLESTSATTIGTADQVTWYLVKNAGVVASERLEVRGTVNLILADGASLTANKGIIVHGGNTLIVYGQEYGTGTLNATGCKIDEGEMWESAAIGSNGAGNSSPGLGDIIFHSGRVNATAYELTAGIGGGNYNPAGGSITIYGGTISATATEPSYRNQEAIGHGNGGGNVSKTIVDGLRVYTNYSTSPTLVEYAYRLQNGLSQKDVRVERCTEHNYSNGRCTYCGAYQYHQITYYGNGNTGGTVPAVATCNVTTGIIQATGTIAEAGTMERTGYTFTGWNTEADGSGTDYAPGQAVTLRSDLTLYAQWNIITYTITYNLNGGTLPEGESNPTTYTIESENITLNNPTRQDVDEDNGTTTNYLFMGWTGTGLGGATKTVTIPHGSVGDRSYTATWDVSDIPFDGMEIDHDYSANVVGRYYVKMPYPGEVEYDYDENGNEVCNIVGAEETPKIVNIPAWFTTPFKVYDDGGKSNSYRYNPSESHITTLILNAPDDKVFSVSGIIYIATWYGDWLKIYDGTTTDNEIDVQHLIDEWGYEEETIIPFVTTGNSIRFDLYSNDGQTPDGLNLTVTLAPAPTKITLANDDSQSEQKNTSVIASNHSQEANVTLHGRTLYRNGTWNTLCLPFDIDDISKTPLKNAAVKTLSTTNYSDGTLTMNFSDNLTALEAGKPYIVKWPSRAFFSIIDPAEDVVMALNFISEVPNVDDGQESDWGYGSENYDKLVDGKTNTKYGIEDDAPYVEFHYSSAITPKGYALWTANDEEGRRNPSSWTISAKNKGDENWTELVTVDNSDGDKLPMANKTCTIFPLDNSTAYQYFRFEASLASNDQFQLAELQFCTVQPDASMLNIVNPTFRKVTIPATYTSSEAIDNALHAAACKTEYVDFIGTFSTVALQAGDKTKLYLASGNNLYYPDADMNINACRAYFQLNGITAGDVAQARLVFGEEETGIVEVRNEEGEMSNENQGMRNADAWYDMQGRRLESSIFNSQSSIKKKGLYIHNGSKVAIK